MSVIRDFLFELLGPTSVFKKGDGVELKTGSPVMVVTSVAYKLRPQEVNIECEWIENQSQQVVTKVFREEELVFMKRDTPPDERSNRPDSGVTDLPGAAPR